MSLGKVILVVLATLVIFSTGLVTGVIVDKQLAKPAPFNRPVVQQGPGPGPGWPQFFHRIQAELDLTPDQNQRIMALLRQSQERTRGLARGEFAKVRDQISAELTASQKEKFERLVKERQRRAQEMRSLENRPPWMTNQ